MPLQPFILNSNMLTHGGAYDYTSLIRDADRNTGNSYVYHSISRLLYGAHVPLPDIRNMWTADLDKFDSDVINKGGFSHAFVIFKDHIREEFFGLPWARLDRFIQRIKIPLVVFSLGANSLDGDDMRLYTKIPKDMANCLRRIADNTVSLSIRGDYTADVLEKLGIRNFKIVGCPSNFAYGPARRIIKKDWDDKLGILTNGPFTSKRHSDKLHFSLQDNVTESLMLKTMLQGGTLDATDFKLIGNPVYRAYLADAIPALLSGRMSILSQFDQWTETAGARFNMAIGGRMHGAISSLNAGIPAVVTNGDSRSREMCKLFSIPHLPNFDNNAHDLDLQKLYETLDYSKMNHDYDGLYKNYLSWLAENGVVPASVSVPAIPSQPELLLKPQSERIQQVADIIRVVIRSQTNSRGMVRDGLYWSLRRVLAADSFIPLRRILRKFVR